MSQKYTEENIPKSCQDVGHYSDKLQYGEATFWERLKLKIHILYCERCKKYNTKNSLLTDIFKKKEYNVLDIKDLEDIKEKVNSKV